MCRYTVSAQSEENEMNNLDKEMAWQHSSPQ